LIESGMLSDSVLYTCQFGWDDKLLVLRNTM